MSIASTYIVWCDDCGEPQDDGDHGHRTRAEAIALAKRHGVVRRKLDDGMAHLCDQCAAARGASKAPAKIRRGPR